MWAESHLNQVPDPWSVAHISVVQVIQTATPTFKGELLLYAFQQYIPLGSVGSQLQTDKFLYSWTIQNNSQKQTSQ